MTLRPDGKLVELETLSDVVKMLSPKEVRRRGVEEQVFTDNGLMISAVGAGLRARGYEVELFKQGRGPAPAVACDPRCSCEAPRRRSGPTLRPTRKDSRSLRGRSVTGRQMYERFCAPRFVTPDWWSLSSRDREAWDELARSATNPQDLERSAA